MKRLLPFLFMIPGLQLSTVVAEGKDQQALKVGITAEIASVVVQHQGKTVVIQRNQDNKNKIAADYSITSRDCPPFCIRPIKLAPGVETIAELEILQYLQKVSQGDNSVLVIDSRTPNWVKKGTIPGSINIPWTQLSLTAGGNSLSIAEVLTDQFGVSQDDDLFDFSNAKTLVMYCNGMWCGQSPKNIKTLIKLGYPADKIKWYRGGMQDWHILGLTTVR